MEGPLGEQTPFFLVRLLWPELGTGRLSEKQLPVFQADQSLTQQQRHLRERLLLCSGLTPTLPPEADEGCFAQWVFSGMMMVREGYMHAAYART